MIIQKGDILIFGLFCSSDIQHNAQVLREVDLGFRCRVVPSSDPFKAFRMGNQSLVDAELLSGRVHYVSNYSSTSCNSARVLRD